MANEQTNGAAAAAVAGSITSRWLSIEAAATAIGVSHRTIHRRLRRDELESRLDDQGRRLVLIALPDPVTAAATDGHQDPAARLSRFDSRATVAPGDAGDPLTVDRPSAQFQAVLRRIAVCHRVDAGRARRAVRLGSLAVAVLAVALTVALCELSRVAVRGSDQVDQAQQQLAAANGRAARAQADRDRAMLELGKALATIDAQTATGRIQATPATSQPSRPARISFVQRLAGVFD